MCLAVNSVCFPWMSGLIKPVEPRRFHSLSPYCLWLVSVFVRKRWNQLQVLDSFYIFHCEAGCNYRGWRAHGYDMDLAGSGVTKDDVGGS